MSEDIKLSGLISALLRDHLEKHSITIQVSEDTRDLYDRVVSTMKKDEDTDAVVEVGLRGVLQQLIDEKIREFEDLKKRLTP